MTLGATTWLASAGSIDNTGLFTAPYASASVTVTATSGSVSGTTVATVTNAAPTIATSAAATPATVTGTTTALSVLGADDAGEANLSYTWATTGTPPAPVTFSNNGDNTAKNTTATFSQAGNYTFQVTITDMGGLTATSSVDVTVDQTLTSITVAPGTPTLASHATQQFTASGLDQFGSAMDLGATTWTATAGSIDNNGLFTAPYASATVTVTATSGLASGTTLVTVTDGAPTVTTAAAATPATVTGTTTALSVLGADDAGEANLTYTWATTGTPPAPVTFSDNGDNTAKNTTATFSQAGNYTFQVTITDMGGLTATSSVDVAVSQTLTSIAVAPAAPTLTSDATEQFSAAGFDQFGSAMDLGTTTWTATAGSIDNNGLFTAPYASATVTVTATSGLVSGTTTVTVDNAAPTVAVAAADPLTGATSELSVLGADDAGESNLTYTWLATNKPGGAADPTYTDNGTNTAKNTMATFFQAGDYTLEVTITDDGGLSTTSSVDVTVDQTLTSITVVPAGGLSADGTEPFAATALDQFGNALVSQPAFAWSLDGGGAISNGGVFSPPYTDGSATVLATSGSVSGSDTVALPGAALWNSAVNASWNDASSWTSSVFGSTVTAPGLRGIPGDAAVFDTAADSTVSLNGSSPSLAGITFNGPGSLTVAQGSGGTLHLDNGSASATVTVAGGNSTIAAPVELDSDLVVSAAAGSTLNLSGGVSGTGSRLTFSGQGTLVLSGANTCSGGTIVSGGTLMVTSATALADGGA